MEKLASIPFDFLGGEVLLIDKDVSWTSFDVVNKIRFLLKHVAGIPKIKVGHAGTLDPMASGLLVICTGKATKQIDQYQAQEKEYTGTFTLGVTTPSFDVETEIDNHYPTDHITDNHIHSTARAFEGWTEQTPPVYSAIKVKGERAYKYARENAKVELRSRKIHIQKFEITQIQMPEVFFSVVCSKGTYIRALARDYGKAMDSGAFMSSLRRTRIGDFQVDNALTISGFQHLLEKLYQNNP